MCRVCQRRVDLRAPRCPCGFDIEHNDPTKAIACARRDRIKALGLLVGGAAGAALLALLAVTADVWWSNEYRVSSWEIRILGLIAAATIFAIGRGASLLYNATHRITTARGIERMPSAQVVSRK